MRSSWWPRHSESKVPEVRIATRGSALAKAQTNLVADRLRAMDPEVTVSLIEIETAGDRDRVGSIAELTELGAFVRAVQEAVLEDRADLAVHSLKDLPVDGPPGLMVTFPERASVEDVLVGARLGGLDDGALVGTGSPRRVAQLLGMRPDLRTTELRGNVDTRLRKVSDREVDAAVMARAGLERLGKESSVSEVLTVDQMVPAPGQGALAVEAREGSRGAEWAADLDSPDLRPLLLTERALLSATGAGCRSALGAVASWEGGAMCLTSFVADDRGPRRAVVTGSTTEDLVAATRRELGL